MKHIKLYEDFTNEATMTSGFKKALDLFKSKNIDPTNISDLAYFCYTNHKLIVGKKWKAEEESDFNEKIYDFIEEVTGQNIDDWNDENNMDFNDAFADFAADGY